MPFARYGDDQEDNQNKLWMQAAHGREEIHPENVLARRMLKYPAGSGTPTGGVIDPNVTTRAEDKPTVITDHPPRFPDSKSPLKSPSKPLCTCGSLKQKREDFVATIVERGEGFPLSFFTGVRKPYIFQTDLRFTAKIYSVHGVPNRCNNVKTTLGLSIAPAPSPIT